MWEIEVLTPDGSTSKATYSDASPGGIAGRLRWSVAPSGDGRQLTFEAKPSAVNIAARDIVKLRIDGQPAFFGYAEQVWPSWDGGLREYRAVGGRKLLRQRLYDGKTYSKQGVAAIVRDIASRLLPPSIQYDPALVPDTGWHLALQGGLGVSLARLFDDLAKACDPPRVWGVMGDGRFFFGLPGGSVNVDQSITEKRPIPLDASDVVTAAVVFVGGLPIRYQAPEHAQYGAEKAWVYPVSTGFKVDRIETHGITEETRDGGVTWQPWTGDTSLLFDQDPATGVHIPDGGDVILYFDSPRRVDSVYVKLETPNNDALVWWVDKNGNLGSYTIPKGAFDGLVTIGAEIVKLGVQPAYLYQPL